MSTENGYWQASYGCLQKNSHTGYDHLHCNPSENHFFSCLQYSSFISFSPKQAGDKQYEEAGSIRSEGDVFLRGAQGHEQHPEKVFRAESFYPSWTLEPADDALKRRLTVIAGWQDIPRPPDSGPGQASSLR